VLLTGIFGVSIVCRPVCSSHRGEIEFTAASGSGIRRDAFPAYQQNATLATAALASAIYRGN
jgi:hypothetical protein